MTDKKWLLYLLIVTFLFTESCESDDSEDEYTGNWVELSSLDGVARCDAVAFSINGKGYIATGYDGKNRLNDLWEYDPERNAWTQKASLPGEARNGAVAFALKGKGYLGTGYDGYYKLNDFWEYNPDSNIWTQKNDFPGGARYGATAFATDTKGYIATGYDGNYLKDLWEYDPDNDEWTQKTSIGGDKRRDAAAFVIDNVAYICTGINNGTYETDLWAYYPSTDTWKKLNQITNTSDETFDDDYNMAGTNRVAFAINGKGYLITGGKSTTSTEVWEYDPVNDLWEKKTPFEGSARMEACGFVIGNRGYVLTGRNSSYYFDDLWAFDPDDEYNEDD